MDTTFVILNWNTPILTVQCIDSLYKHLKNYSFQLVVIDNGSTDNSVEIFKKIQKKYNNIHLVINKTNLGFASGNNSAKSYFNTKFVVFLNSDIIFTNNSIIKAIEYLDSNPEIGLVAPKLVLPNSCTQPSVFPPQTITNAIKEFWFGHKGYSLYSPTSDQPTEVWAIVGAVVILKTSFFKKIGMWNQKYFLYFEDLELCRQIRKYGKKIFYYPQSFLIHHHGQSGTHITSSQNQWKRLVSGSILYHGFLKHYILFFILWIGQKLKKS